MVWYGDKFADGRTKFHACAYHTGQISDGDVLKFCQTKRADGEIEGESFAKVLLIHTNGSTLYGAY